MPVKILRRNLVIGIIICLLIVNLFSGVSPAKAAPRPDPSDPVELGAFLDGVFAARMKADHVPGAVVAVVKDGRLIYSQGYGYADMEKRIPVDPQKTLFRPGSVSKLFTWTAVMQLVEQGRLSLDADVNEYLDFKIPATFPQPITLRHLMTHTPGFEDSSQDLFLLSAEDMLPLDIYLKRNIPLRVYPPGAVSAYSNYGAALAGYIVQRVAGMPFSTYVELNIFEPLGMTHSSFVQPLPEALAPDMARGYNYSGGAYLAGSFEFIPPYPAGALSATAEDLARFMIAHLQNGRYGDARILSEATARQMHSPLFSQAPGLHGMAYGFFESEVNGQAVISHGGDTILFHSGMWLVPEQNLGIFVSTNLTTGGSLRAAIFQAFMDRYYPDHPQAAPPVPAGFAARAGQYAGEYYQSRGNYSTFAKIFRLFSPVKLSPGQEGQVFFSGLGYNNIRFREVEPGRLVADEGPLPALVLKITPSGQVSLLTSEPFEFIKAPWYATGRVHALIFFGGLLLSLGTLLAWGIGCAAGRLRRRARLPQPVGARLARIIAGAFMLVFLVFMLGLALILGNIDPAYGQPRFILHSDAPSAINALLALTPVLGILGVLTLPFVVISWRNCYWSARGRAFYTLLSAWFMILLWAMVYWNMLL